MISESQSRALFAELFQPIADLLADPQVSEILINGPGRIFAERRGQLEAVSARFASELHLLAVVRAVAQYVGRPCDEAHPVLEGRLPDGSRVTALLPPITRRGVHLAIRRFGEERVSLASLLATGSLTREAVAFLRAALLARKNVIIAGGTGTGKTSLLHALIELVPDNERLVVIEDASELRPRHPHVVELEARPPDVRGAGAVSVRDLLRATLRLRPDRILVGEVRDGAALDLLQALSSGHGGSMSTLHATGTTDVLHRLETMALMADVGLPLAALRAQIAAAVDLIVVVERARDGRRMVTHIGEVAGLESRGEFRVANVFVRDGHEPATPLTFVGLSTACARRLAAYGWSAPELGAFRAECS